jgi:DNA-binding PadR family transcriptional regulator
MSRTGVQPRTTGWMRGASASVRGALLGLILERPGHGGDLANRLQVRLGQTWRLDSNDVYRLLEKLQREGLVQARVLDGNGRRPTTVYHPTAETPAALTMWMETLLPREPVRMGLQAKLAVARPEDAPRLMIALKEYAQSCLVLAQLVAPSNGESHSWTALCMDCTRDAAFTQLHAEINWAARTRQRLADQMRRAAQPR